MFPARVDETEQERQLQALAKGFDALLLTAQRLSSKEQELQRRLKYAHDEYLKLANQLPGGPDAGGNPVAEKILNGDPESNLSTESSLKLPDLLNTLRQSANLEGQVLEAITGGLESYKSVVGRHNGGNLCLVAANARGSAALERDFTTNGVKGSLRCPFAKSSDQPHSANGLPNGTNDLSKLPNGNTCGHDDLDPIKAELSQDKFSSPAVSARSSAARCPIRYLDRHKPEEVAQYFENHKHEIPRSHAICVKRYQDSQSMRQLDAKYGSFVNMIQGLGTKHQAFLPNQNRNGSAAAAPSSASAERVERWAEDVSSKSQKPGVLTTVEEDRVEDNDDRKGHFERPLREVRVGESPSRPWGIPVPMTHQPPSAQQSPAAPVPVPDRGSSESKKQPASAAADPSAQGSPTPARPTGQCPFHLLASQQDSPPQTESRPSEERKLNDMSAASKDHASGEPTVSPEMTRSGTPSPTAVVFNGPVFFGYSPEQAASLLQQLGGLNVTK
ncbi:hypothetical protein VTN00DRAFT_7501 [Thermoascus crustaceus]|uniref:uncharacterized protein n=1 Tax=Thermoascus crustaceus TaxID=5088 RepID=UPI0037439A4D